MRNLHWPGRVLAGLGLALATLSGCQTWHTGTGQTLPSPRYLEHPPQFLPPSPPFPLERELADQMRRAANAPEPGVPPVPLPDPVQGGGGGAMQGVQPLAPPMQ